jgi:hypothetical protein
MDPMMRALNQPGLIDRIELAWGQLTKVIDGNQNHESGGA